MPASHTAVRDRLRGLGRHGDDAEADRLLARRRARARRCRARSGRRSRCPTLRGSLSKMRRDDEAARAQAVVAARSPSRVARADEREAMRVVRAEDALDAIDEQRDVVADAALAELTEVREVAPDLRGVDLGELGEPRRGDRLLPSSRSWSRTLRYDGSRSMTP